ncbi:very-short-patch-repair endonuclease [Sphingomonas aerolata]|uniref:Very-short-patch-repair endonuclease n=2 Tax=Sphingomonas aerolata TaxID=185951 RepID=A0A2T4YQD5_9SPHN|nr:very-short-patch-repair endonuclease [Sphingomonas aerolata]
MAQPPISPSPSGEGLGWGTTLAKRATHMRRDPTEPEKRLWRGLSNSQLGGFKFRRQAVLGTRIVDFFCPATGLIVEVDGHTHDPDIDQNRDALMQQPGFTTIRVGNTDVMENAEGVLLHILSVAQGLPARAHWRLPHPNLVPGEGCPASFRPCRGHGRSDTPEGEGL